MVKVHCLPSTNIATHRAAGKQTASTLAMTAKVMTSGTCSAPKRMIINATPKTRALAVSSP